MIYPGLTNVAHFSFENEIATHVKSFGYRNESEQQNLLRGQRSEYVMCSPSILIIFRTKPCPKKNIYIYLFLFIFIKFKTCKMQRIPLCILYRFFLDKNFIKNFSCGVNQHKRLSNICDGSSSVLLVFKRTMRQRKSNFEFNCQDCTDHNRPLNLHSDEKSISNSSKNLWPKEYMVNLGHSVCTA